MKLARSLAAAALVTFTATPAFARPTKPVDVSWRGETYELHELPDDVDAGARSALAFWEPWAEEHDYRMALEGDGRVLYVYPRKTKKPKKALGLIRETCAVVDAVVPPTPPQPPVSGPDGPVVKADPGADTGGFTWTWEDLGAPLETETGVVLELADPEAYETVLDRLAESHEYLESWAPGAKDMTGFVLERPLCAAFLRAADGLEEWDPKNELVNRTAQLLFLRRIGRQPYWLTMGLAWYVENEVRGTLYSFPYRDDFVLVAEHADWNRQLRRLYKKRDSVPMKELASWTRGTFDRDSALRAFGVATFLARHHTDALPALFGALRQDALQQGRVTHDDGTWELIPGYEPPAETQAAIFTAHVGDGHETELARFFQKWSSYKPRKK